MARNIARINNYLQLKLQEAGLEEVTLQKAARWLHEAGILKDSKSSPGFPLRRLAKNQKIVGAYQKKGWFWFIRKIPQYHLMLSVEEVFPFLGLKNKRSVYAYVKRHGIPHLRIDGNQIVFRGEEFYSWLVFHDREEQIEENHKNKFEEVRQKIDEMKIQLQS